MPHLSDQERIALGKKIYREQGLAGMKDYLNDDCVCMGFVQAQYEARQDRRRLTPLPDV